MAKILYGAFLLLLIKLRGLTIAMAKDRPFGTFCREENKIFQNHTGDIACDFYNHYIHDLELMHSLNILNYRFSISWSRILPDGTGKVNQLGIDFYNRLIDLSLELEITPWITLYHWDLPHALEKKGGWRNRDIKEWFGDYVTICVKHFGNRVKNWIVLNEPTVFTAAGYFFGIHAPGKKAWATFYLPSIMLLWLRLMEQELSNLYKMTVLLEQRSHALI